MRNGLIFIVGSYLLFFLIVVTVDVSETQNVSNSQGNISTNASDNVSTNNPILLTNDNITDNASQSLGNITDKDYYNMGLSLYDVFRFNDAFYNLSKAIELNPNNGDYYYVRGQINYEWAIMSDNTTSYVNIAKCRDAISDFDQAIKLNPSKINSYYIRADIYANCLGNDREAISDYTTFISLETNKLNPILTYVYNDRATSYFYQSKYKEAIEDYTQAINLAKDNPFISDAIKGLIYYNRAMTYRQIGDNPNALLDQAEACRLDKTNCQ
jgi:tetratricopeptide (TPR) repeat protein